MLKKISFASLVLATTLFGFEKGSLGLNINQDDVEFEGRASVSFITDSPVYSNFFVNGNFINADEKLYGLGLSVENSPINYQNIVFNIGLRSVFSEHSGSDFSAMPISIGAKAQLFFGDLPTTYIGAKAAYAPSALSFQDADEYKEYRFEIDSKIIPNINIYAGYRNIDTDYKSNKTYNLSDSYYAGFKFVLDPR
jgi:hypothetical protein